MIYEIINPSDRCCVVADDPKVATMACWLIGPQYGLADEDGVDVCGMHFFGWPTLNGGIATVGQFDELLQDTAFMLSVTECLESLMYCGPGDRRAIMAASPSIDVAAYNEAKRTSMTNIGARARALAEGLRQKFGGEPA